MATTTAVSPAAPEPQPQMSAISRVFGVLFSPQKTFEDIVRKPGWVLPIVLLTILSIAVSFGLNQRVNWREFMSQQIEKSPQGAQLSTEQKEQRIEAGAKFAPISTYVFGTLGPLLIALIMALVMWGAYSLLGGASTNFSTAMAITAHAFMTGLISSPLFLLVIFLKAPGTIDLDNPVATNLAAFLPDDSDLWTRLDARRDTCSGQKCPSFNPCFVTGMHQRAKDADLIIVNHHLFFADLALKQDDFGSILPEYSAVVFDEAHEMEDVASDYFGRQISNFRFEELARDADQTLRLLHLGTPSLLRRTQRIRERSRTFFETFPPRDGRFPFSRNEREAFLEQNREAYDDLASALKGFETECAAMTQKPEEILRIARRSFELRQELTFLFESNERNFVYWYERRNKGVFLAATPIDVSQILRERLFEQFDTVVLTSATLTVGNRFEFIRHRLGLDHAKERGLPPEFDYEKQAMLYLPQNMPDVRNPAFTAKAADEIVNLLETSQGRAFCLFTSYSQMNELFERVRTRVPFPLLLQGTSPRSVLLERFKNTPGAVLFATASFWQGVDVPGEQLSCVIVDRLPFAVPSDPIVAARVAALQEDGRNPFAEFQVPQAVLALKQGFGRLIRTKTDRGVLALLDSRIQRMAYGKIFLESLPKYKMTSDLAEVSRFLAKKKN